MVTFWAKLKDANSTRLSGLMYDIIFSHSKFIGISKADQIFPWLKTIKEIFIKCGQYGLWDSQSFPNITWLKKTIQQKLTDLFINKWYSEIEQSSKCNLYRTYKSKFGLEKYLVNTPPNLLFYLVKYRTRNHKLPIENGRWNNIPTNLRICNLCQKDIGDEFHYLLQCTVFSEDRKRFIKKKYFVKPNIYKFHNLMNNPNRKEVVKMCRFIKIILKKFNMT